ncbi:DinB family protein [Lacinutrix iliipiscaria]|uniref:DinB family protein n=1 Tax=Lacinutrix iliipiscaria TaxID=1230532 RepID=A0ABW5WIB4_9FLAO
MEYNFKLAIEVLSQTPKTLQSFLGDLSEDWIQRLNIILNDTVNKTFQPFDRFAQFEASKGKTIQQLLDEFIVLRQLNLEYLNTLTISETQLQLKGNHPELGEVALKQLLASWVTHDLGHIAQIARVLAKQYKTEVGPWKAYIPILNK